MTLALLPQESGHQAAGVVTSGALLDWAGLLVVAPLVAMFLIIFFGKRLPLQGGELAVAAMAFVTGYAAILAYQAITEGILYERSIEVAAIGSLTIQWGWVID